MEMADGYMVTEAVPLDDGSLVTTLVDQDGQQVGTVTRLPDGSTSANVPMYDVGSGREGFDWTNVLTKVTSFLDNVAKSAQQTSDEAARLSNAAKGAVQGAKIGYNAPINWQPYVIGGSVIVGAVIVAYAMVQHAKARG